MSQAGEKQNLPKHIGFIMDGNRRWGKIHHIAKPIEGTRQGRDTLYDIADACKARGIKEITAWAFSTENWRRSKAEVAYLMELLLDSISGFTQKALNNDIRLNFIGRLNDFPEKIQNGIKEATAKTKHCQSLNLNMASSYGGRAEIVDATKKIVKEGIKEDEINEDVISKHLYADLPPLDLIVRTGGAQRTSGFMLWLSDYSELYFTDTLWPDFNEIELEKALRFFAETKRNFGK